MDVTKLRLQCALDISRYLFLPQVFTKVTPCLARQGDCEFQICWIFWLCHCRDISNILLYWTAIYRESIVIHHGVLCVIWSTVLHHSVVCHMGTVMGIPHLIPASPAIELAMAWYHCQLWWMMSVSGRRCHGDDVVALHLPYNWIDRDRLQDW